MTTACITQSLPVSLRSEITHGRKQLPAQRDDEELKVPDGTSLPLATSALVKCLRHGAELDAAYWAQQLEYRFPKYLWRRLAIFAAEDVGLADTSAIIVVSSLRTAYEQIAKESRAPRPDGSLIGLAVLVLCRAPKNQEASNLMNALQHLREDGWRGRIPDEAIDGHTAEGKNAMPRSNDRLRFWLERASKAHPERGTKDWRLWIERWAARRGAVSSEHVEQQADEWLNEGRLIWGAQGYEPSGPDGMRYTPYGPSVDWEIGRPERG